MRSDKFQVLAVLVILASFHFVALGQPDLNLLSGHYNREALDSVLISYDDWHPFPRIDDRQGWDRADQQLLSSHIPIAESYLDYTWPHIPATASLAYVRTGDRNEYQGLTFKKRIVLGTLLLAEIAENKGRFIDQIVNGVWSICEESFWGVPAHLPGEVDGLANTADPIVDLFAAETATFLAWADYFLGDQFDAITPQIRQRIHRETEQRIFKPLMSKYHRWMGPTSTGRGPNNWNPWICSNWINTALLLEPDNTQRVTMIHRALEVLDEFINPYPQDGGCDEGPSYWGAAAASLYDNISLLNLATNDAFTYVYENQKFRNMGQFIYKAQISEAYFLNFADADPQPKMAANMIWRYGRDIDDEKMMQFGAYYHDAEKTGEISRFHYFRNLFDLFIQDEMKATPRNLPLPADIYLPDLQVMISRDQEGTTNGFYLAAKGGHNDESHNHNDIGNFVVYFDGQPLLIDVGRGTYTRKTFSSDRYDIWYNCSDFHNTPTIGGITQSPGPEFKASRVNYVSKESLAEFSLDISRAYPDNEIILRWQRSIALDKQHLVMLRDAFRLREAQSINEHIMTCYPAYVKEPGTVMVPLKKPDGSVINFLLKYNEKDYEPTVEKVNLTAVEDQGIIQKWGDRIYRINFNSLSPMRNGSFDLSILQEP
ncbi:MAG: heparinase [Saprospiraceae bacterium]|nr:heparinase [Saprospiraceae bacterium]